MLNWDRSVTLPLAKSDCTTCKGIGLTMRRDAELRPCKCVRREIFRVCLGRFRVISEAAPRMNATHSAPLMFSRFPEEYMADFVLMCKRTLSAADHQLFKFHYLLGADWKACCRRMGMDRGNFFHACYRIEAELGRAFAETEPYGLFPLHSYFNPGQNDKRTTPPPPQTPASPPYLRFPVPKPPMIAQDADPEYQEAV